MKPQPLDEGAVVAIDSWHYVMWDAEEIKAACEYFLQLIPKYMEDGTLNIIYVANENRIKKAFAPVYDKVKK